MDDFFDLDPYFGKTADPDSLINYIYTPLFLKTKIDVLYFDVLNWEKYDLLDIDLGLATVKSEYKKTAISFVQYVWIKMVEGLNSYGFSYDDIRAIRTKLGRKLHFSPYNNKKVASNESLETSYNNSEAYRTDFENYVLSTIASKNKYHFFFYKDAPEDFFVFNDGLLKDFNKAGMGDYFLEKFYKDHFSVSLFKLFEPFIHGESHQFETRSISMLSDEEDKVLRMIRRNYEDLKSITIRFNKSKPTHLEIKSTKKVAAQSRIMDHIKKKDYSTIVIQTVDGNVVNFENTRKYKL
jgi:hypothetical protein